MRFPSSPCCFIRGLRRLGSNPLPLRDTCAPWGGSHTPARARTRHSCCTDAGGGAAGVSEGQGSPAPRRSPAAAWPPMAAHSSCWEAMLQGPGPRGRSSHPAAAETPTSFSGKVIPESPCRHGLATSSPHAVCLPGREDGPAWSSCVLLTTCSISSLVPAWPQGPGKSRNEPRSPGLQPQGPRARHSPPPPFLCRADAPL